VGVTGAGNGLGESGALAAGPRAPDGRLRLPWLDPDDHTWAVAVPRRGAAGASREARDRRGRLKIDRVDLVRATPPERDTAPAARPGASGLDPTRERWLLDATTRRWAAVTSTFGAESHATARRLVDRGVVELRVPVTGAVLDLERPYAWRLTDNWQVLAARARRSRADDRGRAAEEARAAANLVGDLDAELARALVSAPDHWPLLPVLVSAARDLASGVRHDGPRAFSQVHFGDSKLRENAPDILREAGVGEETIDLLGLRRSPYVGFGGPIVVTGFPVSDVPGPVRFRADPHRPLDVRLHPAATRLLLVENLQAAEAVCDTRPDIATVWFAGQPADTVLAVCLALAQQASRHGLRVLVAPDADLGGANIVNRLLDGMPVEIELEIIDVGGVTHPPGSAFSERTLTHLGRLRHRAERGGSGPHSTALADYVAALIHRGHAVEQEATIRVAIDHCLSR
jgi:hypothetical protein